MLLVWMSRSAIPARFSPARTRSICAAFCASAARAVVARVITPAEMIATSGTRVASPVALMSSRVPDIWTTPPTACAPPALGTAAAPRSSAAKNPYRILFILPAGRGRRSPTGHGSGMNGAKRLDSPPLGNEAVDGEQDERADDGSDESGALSRVVPADHVPKPPGDEC